MQIGLCPPTARLADLNHFAVPELDPAFHINADLDRIQLFTSVQIWIGSNFYFNEGPNPDPDPALSK